MKTKYFYTFLIFFAILMVFNPLMGILFDENATFIDKFFYPIGIIIRALFASYFSWRYVDKIFKGKVEG